jgi:hypothetical protein
MAQPFTRDDQLGVSLLTPEQLQVQRATQEVAEVKEKSVVMAN